ncbi:MAG TPA: hypothetical protein VHX42_02290 [Candidatus Babeliales bacterium]|jgi:hypothetical protein|nr:hypothetical protein [Candidatus Babeliales bacterium]
MFTKLQLVVLGIVVLQGIDLGAMDKSMGSPRKVTLSCSAEARKEAEMMRAAIKRPVEADQLEKHAKRQCMHVSIPKYILEEKLNWHVELEKNPNLVWLPI